MISPQFQATHPAVSHIEAMIPSQKIATIEHK
jgi:hypothetical protein